MPFFYSDMDLIKKFYKFVFQYKWSFIFGSILIIVASGLDNLGSFYTKYIIDDISQPNPNLVQIANTIAGFVAVMLLSTGISQFAWTITDRYILNGMRDFKIKVIKKLHELDFSYHANKKSGSLISVIRRGEGAFFSFNHELNREVLIIIVDFVFIVFAFSALDYRLTLVVLISVTIMLIATGGLLKRNVQARKDVNQVEDDISGIVADNLINFETVKYFANEKFEQKRLIDTYKIWSAKTWGYMFSYRLIEVFTSCLIIVSYVAIIILTLNLYTQKAITSGDIVLILTFMFRFYPQFFSLIF